MNKQDAHKALNDWRENNPVKYDAWFWYYSGVKAQEVQEYESTDGYHVIPFGKFGGGCFCSS